ncbi:hypothetical protein [Ruminococcus sp. Marseille-P6503]|uniref:hypothetical protein n=1 Tax=Ruminococcus sp. Marseille-P6503 TaxID=2364796 RepID=UPI000F535F49|nr:hypothetical protein [Ruminococcus sp. Marseille-P6503]
MESNIRNIALDAGEENGYAVPEECAESEKAIGELNKENLKAQYDFINLITLVFIFLCAAAVFIIFTSSKRYGDEGNKFSLERLVSGEYTAEIQSRYESSLPFPKQIRWLEERVSLIYGIGNTISDSEGVKEQGGEEMPNSFDEPEQNRHEEKSVTTTTAEEKKTQTKKPEETAPVYKTTYKRTTEETTTTTEETTTVTTTNNDAPQVNTTVTVPPTTEKKTSAATTTTTTKKQTTTSATTTTTSASTTSASEQVSDESSENEAMEE